MRILYLISVTIHVLAACAWIGGMLFLSLVVVPVIRRPEIGRMGPLIIRLAGQRFRVIGWILLGTLVVTGTLNLAYRGGGFASLWGGHLFDGVAGHALGGKLLLAAAILALSAVHDFWLGPRAGRLLQQDPASPHAQVLRRRAQWMGRVNLLFAMTAAAAGVLIVRGGG